MRAHDDDVGAVVRHCLDDRLAGIAVTDVLGHLTVPATRAEFSLSLVGGTFEVRTLGLMHLLGDLRGDVRRSTAPGRIEATDSRTETTTALRYMGFTSIGE